MIQLGNDKLTDNSGYAQERLKQLERYTRACQEYQKKQDSKRVALCVNSIYRDRLFLESGEKDIYSYCQKHFNIVRGAVGNYNTVARKFLDRNTGYSIFADGKRDFSFSCLLKLKSLLPDEIRELLKDGTLTLETTARDCEAIVAGIKARKKEAVKQDKEESLKPIKQAYEDFHMSYNELRQIVQDNDTALELMQKIMDCVVILYNQNDRLWKV